MRLCVVLRSYGGDNDKDRPAYFSKALVVASFIRAAQAARAADVQVEVVFANDGPIPASRLAAMQANGRVLSTDNGPVGLLGSYRFALDIPEVLGLSDDDVIAYVEDDYLLVEDAFIVLAAGAQELRGQGVEYFAISGSRPTDLNDPVERKQHGVPRQWHLRPDIVVAGHLWVHILSVTSTFAARVGPLRADRDIHELAMRPFRSRFLDHEMCLMYQGVRSYYGTDFFFGLPGDFVPGLRGVARALWLLPYRFSINARARAQHHPHYLYAAQPSLAAHLEVGVMPQGHDWAAEAATVWSWAQTQDGPISDLAAARQTS